MLSLVHICHIICSEYNPLVQEKSESSISWKKPYDKLFDQEYKKNGRYVFCIQGASCSGKSTLADTIENLFTGKGGCYTLHLDDFYKNITNEQRESKKKLYNENEYHFAYDFDNPAAFDWENLHKCIDDIYDEKKTIFVPKYNFITEKFELIKHVFEKTPRIVIIEGLYAFNIFNARVFDISKFSVNDSSREINNFFVDNVRKYEKFIVRNIFLKIDQKEILNHRIRRDVKDRGKDFRTVNLQCEYQVIPNTDKYVNHIEFKSDVQIESGNHNDTKIQALINEILKFFELNKKRN